MYKRIVVIPVLTIVVILILMLSTIHLPPIQHAGFGVAMSIFTEDEENSIFLPLVSNKPWPDLCYAPGTKYYQPSEIDIPEITLQHGTTITVTTTTDTINGDITSVSGLQSNPGADGIALREAISATNNDPGEYTINFSPSLDGSTIYTGGGSNQDLPPLLGGSVIINGDIDGDSTPDIKIANASTFAYPRGITIESSHNTLYALEMEGYFIAVLIIPLEYNSIYRGITVSNMVVHDGLVGVNLHAGPNDDSWDSNNYWEDILISNNNLDVKQDGITFHLNQTIGDHLDNVTVHHNTIHVSQEIDSASFGIQFMAGFWAESDNNWMTNITITHNTITGNADQSIALLSGAVGGSNNLIGGVNILENEILISDTNFPSEAGKWGINLITGDGGTDYIDPDYQPIIYPQNNIMRDVNIIDNVIEGVDGRGIQVLAGCCGSHHNKIDELIILNNQIRLQIPDISYDVTGILIRAGDAWPDPHTADNQVSNVVIQDNTFLMGAQKDLPNTHFAASAISVNGGGGSSGADRNQIHNIWVSLNQIDSVVPGVHLNGAWEGSNENVVDTAFIYCNTITNEPIFPYWDPPFKGIVLTGAIRDSTLNRVENVSLFHNDVSGTWNDLTIIPNIDDTAVENVVSYQIIP